APRSLWYRLTPENARSDDAPWPLSDRRGVGRSVVCVTVRTPALWLSSGVGPWSHPRRHGHPYGWKSGLDLVELGQRLGLQLSRQFGEVDRRRVLGAVG